MSAINCDVCQDTGEVAYQKWSISKQLYITTTKGCQACCPHNEHDHFICLDCDYEGEPSDWYNEDAGEER